MEPVWDLDVREYGDAGLLVALRGGTYVTRWRQTQALARALRGSPTHGVLDVVGTYEDIFVAFDPVHTDHAAVEAAVRTVARACAIAEVVPIGGRTFEIPVLYGHDVGPDLASVAAAAGISPTELVHKHTAHAWTVRFVASPTGAPFADRVETADGTDWEYVVTRMASPRTVVPAGSVALSGMQCMIYPHSSPGGWRLIGRTPLRLVDPTSERLIPYTPGDRLNFVAVDAQRFAQLTGTLLDSVDNT